MLKNKKKLEEIVISGKHSVFELLETNPKIIKKIYIKQKSDLENFYSVIKEYNIFVEEENKLPNYKSLRNEKTQGVVAILKFFKYDELLNVLNNIKNQKYQNILILDKIENPQNFGALIRSANLFKFDAIIIQEKNQVPVTSGTIKASSGTIWSLPIILVSNLFSAIKLLKEKGFWIYGTDLSAEADDIRKVNFSPKTAIILGNEGKGISKNLSDNLDFNIFIPTANSIDSLNVSVAGAIIMYQVATYLKRF